MFDITQLNTSTFRGVPFYTMKTSSTSGKRLTNHTFINGGTLTESNGLKEKTFTIEAFIVGDNYLVEKENLITALDNLDSGILIDKFYGELDCEVDTYTVEEDREKYGLAVFKIKFVKVENKPIEEIQTLVVEDITENATTAFNDNFDNELGDTALQSVISGVQDSLKILDNSVSFLDNTLDEIIETRNEIGKAISSVKSNILSIESLTNDILEVTSSFDDVFDLGLFQKEDQIQFQNSLLENLKNADTPTNDIVQQKINRSVFVYTATFISIMNQKAIQNLENIEFTTGDEFGSVKDSSLELYELLEQKLSELSETNTNISQTVQLNDFMNKLKDQRNQYIFFYTQKYSRLQDLKSDDVVATIDVYSYALDKYNDIDRINEVLTNNDILDPIFISQDLQVLDR